MKRILIINLAFIGDVLLSTPVARALRHAYPQARIDMMTVPVAAPLAQRNPYVDEVIVYDKKGKHKKWKALWQLLRQIRSRNYDLAVCTNFAPRGAMLAFLCGIPQRIGYAAQHGEWFLTDPVSAVRKDIRHEAENYLDVLAPLGLHATDTSLELQLVSQDYVRLPEKVKEKQRMILCPVGRNPLRSWTVEGYQALLCAFPTVEWFLVGGKENDSYLQDLAGTLVPQDHLYAGTHELSEIAALFEGADVIVSVDTALLHIAQAVKTPVVGLFGPGDPRVWGPRGENDKLIWLNNCPPCANRKDCPNNRCMREIPADLVIQAVKDVLQR